MIDLEHRRLLVCVGPGGVGKTSVSAALGLAAARAGRRVFVLTIDPARRLADALGISLGDREAQVQVPGAIGTLHAAMLETRESWDAFVGRMASDPDQHRRILENGVYRAFSRTLARSHAYVALERLHHVLEERDPSTGEVRWDLVILDTPPTRSALDVLDAPSGLARFADERVVSAFVGAGSALARPGAAALRRALGLVMGATLVDELAGFVELFAPMRAGFASRARAVQDALHARDTAFALVAAPGGAQLEDAAFLRADLARRGVRLDAIVLNRAFHVDPEDRRRPIARGTRWDPDAARATLAGAPGGSAEEAARAVDAVLASRRRALAEDLRAEAAIDRFVGHALASVVVRLPLLPREPCSVGELLGMVDAGIRTAGTGPGPRP